MLPLLPMIFRSGHYDVFYGMPISHRCQFFCLRPSLAEVACQFHQEKSVNYLTANNRRQRRQQKQLKIRPLLVL